ncbi:MAG TPA: hypothetical protein VKH43_11315, partial [Thermoanaerobaculia bacterium]|nr:hypothetical protein [Thermoanaerobaculia bacterium]
DWSAVAIALFENPSDPANPAFMSVPLSLANVYLNRYEARYREEDLDRSISLAEWVAWNRALWGSREGSGAVVSYLDITVARLSTECSVGGFDSRVEQLRQAAMAITAEEADAVAGTGSRCGGVLRQDACLASIVPYPTEPDALASRAALLAAAASFLPDDPRAPAWSEKARQLASSLPSGSCESSDVEIVRSQGRLSFLLSGGEVPPEFGSGWTTSGGTSVLCPSASARSYETPGSVGAVNGAEALDLAIRDSRVVVFVLSEIYLWIFPPGSQCEEPEVTGDFASSRRAR